MPYYLSFNLPNKRITYCDDICNYMSVHGLIVVFTLSALINQSATNICRPYSSSNKGQIVNIHKRKIRYFILNISMTLLVCRSNALNKSLNSVCTYKILATKHISLEVLILG